VFAHRDCPTTDPDIHFTVADVASAHVEMVDVGDRESVMPNQPHQPDEAAAIARLLYGEWSSSVRGLVDSRIRGCPDRRR
jgi:hypothetical protein